MAIRNPFTKFWFLALLAFVLASPDALSQRGGRGGGGGSSGGRGGGGMRSSGGGFSGGSRGFSGGGGGYRGGSSRGSYSGGGRSAPRASGGSFRAPQGSGRSTGGPSSGSRATSPGRSGAYRGSTGRVQGRGTGGSRMPAGGGIRTSPGRGGSPSGVRTPYDGGSRTVGGASRGLQSPGRGMAGADRFVATPYDRAKPQGETSFNRGSGAERAAPREASATAGRGSREVSPREASGRSGKVDRATPRGTPAADPRSGGRATAPTEAGRRGGAAADPRGSEGRGGRGAARAPGGRKPQPRDPAPGESWRGQDHRSWSHDPDHNDHDGDCHFHGSWPFWWGFGWGAWWWWDSWWWWSWPWWPHYHYVPVSATVYEPIYVPSTVYCEEVRTPAEPTTQEAARDEDLATRQVRLADLYFRAGKYEEAASAYRRAIESSPGSPSLHFTLADALFATGDVAGAAKEIRQGVRLDATLVAAEVDKRGFYGKGEDFDLQVASLEARVASDPADRDALLLLGYNYLFSARTGMAKEAFEKARALPGAGEAEGIFFAEADRRLKSEK